MIIDARQLNESADVGGDIAIIGGGAADDHLGARVGGEVQRRDGF
jgi:hypothetical protein